MYKSLVCAQNLYTEATLQARAESKPFLHHTTLLNAGIKV